METKSYNTIDKSEWPRGEWDNEPDKVQWQDQATQLPCLAVRGPGGHWCGYVGVSEGHPYFKKEYDACDVQVHWGLTYSDHCQETESECDGVCHQPDESETDNVWWLGFDCAHSGDMTPKWATYFAYRAGLDTYRNLAFVQAECASLAQQLKTVAP
ncbi:hypothetical protein [Roseicella sp. DB1501]|uniref:hypothetical protein n=1 Tax=Roseicella sp. DB1501 TaxID=2730925 RepID=UPI0014920411|nr:hypothetical protein [Roseicella sp. DB1501]NOG70463.1 hypothetical protein [Roseicella sp. DB1501]